MNQPPLLSRNQLSFLSRTQPHIIAHYSTVVSVPILKAFEYFMEIEYYPQRYPNFCKSEVLERADGSVVTRKFWNEYDAIKVKKNI